MDSPAVKFIMNAVVLILAACVPAGFVLALYTNDTRWLWLCAPILIFLS